MPTEDKKEDTTNEQEQAKSVDAGRRDAMLKMAAYTAPALLMTLTSEKAMAVSVYTPPPKPPS
jgi:hypothetical protein